MTFPDCAVFKLTYFIETGEKLLRIRPDDNCSSDYKMFLKLGTEPMLATIFDKIKEKIEKTEQSTLILYLTFNLVKVLNKRKTALETANDYLDKAQIIKVY